MNTTNALVSVVITEIITKVNVTVTVKNEKYVPELNDTNSQQYIEFDKRFQDEVSCVHCTMLIDYVGLIL